MQYSRIVAVVVAVVACGIGGGATTEGADPPTVETSGPLADGMNAFGTAMFSQLSSREGNLFFSPLSLHAALSMTSVGARGETHAEMATVLALPPGEAGQSDPARVGPLYREFFASLRKDAGGGKSSPELTIANGLWLNKQLRLAKGFGGVVKKDFLAEASTVDFSKPDAAAKEVNDWVAKQTKDRIRDILSPSSLNRDTVLLLANAIHFKSAWADAFSKDKTTDGEFRLGGDKTVKTKLMSRQGEYEYAETDDAQVLCLPYAGHTFSMVIVLPKTADGLAELEKTLSAEQLKAWTTFESETVRVTLPRFNIMRDFDAKEPLEAMGMVRAFSDKADLSGMIEDEKNLHISFVVHKAFVAVDESGTEAAAATVVGIARTAAPLQPKEPKEFKADHPFLFLIRHNDTGAILFLGRLADPTKE